MQISFYVLGKRYLDANGESNNSTSRNSNFGDDIVNDTAQNNTIHAQNNTIQSKAILDFICRLTQTVLIKSSHSLLIVDNNLERLKTLDAHLWSFDAVSFIPHSLVLPTSTSIDAEIDTDARTQDLIELSSLNDPVTLMSQFTNGFDGVVLNLAPPALPLIDNSVLPERVLEIITPDEISKQQGREKYKVYKNQGFELKYFPID